MHRLLLLAALLIAAPVYAQDVITPGHSDVDTSVVESEEMNYSIRVKQGPAEQTIGTVVTSLSINEEAGEIESIRAYEMMGQKLADTTVAVWPSLASISHVSNNPQRRLQFSVADGMITGTRSTPGGEPESFEMSADGPVFDSAWMSTLAAALPLQDNYEVTVSAFEADEAGLSDYTLSASGPVDLELPSGQKYEVWHVTATNPGGESVHYFYATEDGALLQIRMTPQPGVEVFIDAVLADDDGK